MKALIVSFLALFFFDAEAQTRAEEEYRIASFIIDSISSLFNFQYFFPDEPVNDSPNTCELFPDSLFAVYDPDTYEEITRTGRELDAIGDKAFRIENKLYAPRREGKKDIILIHRFRDENLHRIMDHTYRYFDDVFRSGIDLNELKPYRWDFKRIVLREHIECLKYTKANIHKYKYLTKAFIQMSNVVFNSLKDRALVEFYYHHKVGNGTSGGGMFILLVKENDKWRIIKLIGLSEE